MTADGDDWLRRDERRMKTQLRVNANERYNDGYW